MPAKRLPPIPGVPATGASARCAFLVFGLALAFTPTLAAQEAVDFGEPVVPDAPRPARPAAIPTGGPTCPIPRIHGVLGQGSPDWAGGTGTQTGRILRDGNVSSCIAPKPFPGIGAATGDRTYDAYAFVNANTVPACVSVTLTVDEASACDTMAVAYLGEFDPENVDQLYLADPGVSSGDPPPNPIPPFSFAVGAGQAVVVVVHDVDGVSPPGCGYILDVSGLCPLSPTFCFTANSVYVSEDVPKPIADNLVTTSTIDVSFPYDYVFDVNVFTDIIHPSSADLDITIESPGGRVVTLTTDNGGTNDNVFHGTLWDDQANKGGQVPYAGNAGLATDHPYADDVVAPWLAPEEPLGAFYATNPNGTWTLSVSDDSAMDQGALLGWSLQITTLPALPTSNLGIGSQAVTPVPIPAGPAVVTSTIDYSNAPGSRLCTGVTVITDITHTNASNLDITLQSPAGTVATLTTDNGGSNDDVFAGTTWNSFANLGGQVPYDFNDGLATDHSYADGVPVDELAPEESFAVFAGEDPRGIWTLTISDDTAGDSGTLNEWSLNLGFCSCATATPAAPVYADAHAVFGSDSNLNGVAEVGETFEFAPAWTNTAGIPIWLTSTYMSDFTGAPGPTYTIVDQFSDYGALAVGETANCYDATGQTYKLQITGLRPAITHFDAAATEQAAPTTTPTTPDGVPGSTTKLWRVHVGESFADVPTTHLFYRFVETILHNAVTGGCGGSDYCPDNPTRRDQMAVFVLKAEEGGAYVPPACTGVFADVPCPGPFTDWIEELADRGVVAGCGGGNYCPDSPVLRQQMAVFLLKTHLGAGYVPPACTGVFGDVPCPSPFADWIEDLYTRGITGGCGGGNYCPTASTTRGQMAVFIQKTFELLLYGP